MTAAHPAVAVREHMKQRNHHAKDTWLTQRHISEKPADFRTPQTLLMLKRRHLMRNVVVFVALIVMSHFAVAYSGDAVNDGAYLIALYGATAGSHWSAECSSNWNLNNGMSVCDGSRSRTEWSTIIRVPTCSDSKLNCSGGYYSAWYGVYCNMHDRVQVVDLPNCNLNGTMPAVPDGGALEALRGLRLSGNPLLGGSVSAFLGGPLPELQDVLLGSCTLEGSIPEAFSSLASLRRVRLGSNQLSGLLPESWVAPLVELDVSSNALEGTLPASYATLSALTLLDVSSNRIEGVLPPGWGDLQNLSTLSVRQNRLRGVLPASYGQLTSLTKLYADNNTLSGTLPASYGQLASLQTMTLQYNELHGPLPRAWTSLSSLALEDPYGLFNIPGIRLDHNCLNPTVRNTTEQAWWDRATHGGLTGYLVPQYSNCTTATISPVSPVLPMRWRTPMKSRAPTVSLTLTVVTFSHDASRTPCESSTPSFGVAHSSTTKFTSVTSATTLSPSITHSTHHSVTSKNIIATTRSASLTLSAQTVSVSASSSITANVPLSAPAPSGGAVSGPASASNGASMLAGQAVRALLGGVAASGGVPLFQQRLLMAAGGGSSCDEESLGVADSPLRLVVGPTGSGGAHLGAVLGNIALCLCVLVLAAVVGTLHAAAARDAKDEGRRVRGCLAVLRQGLRTARLPGWWLGVLVVPLLPSTLASSAVVLSQCDGVDAGSGAVGVLGVLWSCGVLLYVVAACDPRDGYFGAAFRVGSAAGLAVRAAVERAVPQWVARVLGTGGARWGRTAGAWRDASAAHAGFVRSHGALFEGYVSGRQWWCSAELALSLVIAAVSGSAPASSVGAAWSIAAVLVAWLVVHAVWTPYRLRCDHVVAVALAALSAAAAALRGAALEDGDASGSYQLWIDGIAAASAVVSVAAAVVPLVAELRWQAALIAAGPLRPDDLEGMTSAMHCVIAKIRAALTELRSIDSTVGLLLDSRGAGNDEEVAMGKLIMEGATGEGADYEKGSMDALLLRQCVTDAADDVGGYVGAVAVDHGDDADMMLDDFVCSPGGTWNSDRRDDEEGRGSGDDVGGCVVPSSLPFSSATSWHPERLVVLLLCVSLSRRHDDTMSVGTSESYVS